MPHYELLFPSKYIRAADLQGRDVALTIRRVAIAELTRVGGQKERKPHVWFEEKREPDEKMLVLNKTNAKSIAKLYGPNTEDWVGKRVMFYPTTTRGQGGEEVACIRVRETKPPPKRRKQQPEPSPEMAEDHTPEAEEAAQ